MKNPEEILTALSKLDPTNDSQWTDNGLPRLGAVGEGFTRAEINAVAPEFRRDNTECLDNKAKELEVEAVKAQEQVLDRLGEIKKQRNEAQKELTEAHAMRTQAEKNIKIAFDKFNKLSEEEKALDTRSDAEINRELLKSNFQQRLELHEQQKVARALLAQAGLQDHVKDRSASPLDNAISAKITADRRAQLAGRK